MDINCTACTSGTNSAGDPCGICGGDGLVSLSDENFDKYTNRFGVHGVVWDAILTKLTDMEDKVNDIKEKVDDVKAVVDEL